MNHERHNYTDTSHNYEKSSFINLCRTVMIVGDDNIKLTWGRFVCTEKFQEELLLNRILKHLSSSPTD